MLQHEILQTAPEAPGLESKLAYYCTECPWWTNRTGPCEKPEGAGPLKCPKCHTPLRFTELETYLNLHQHGLTDEHRKKWLGSFDQNWGEQHGQL